MRRERGVGGRVYLDAILSGRGGMREGGEKLGLPVRLVLEDCEVGG